MRFYDCATAPSPRRVRFFIAEKGLDIPVTQVDLAAGEQLADEFLAINPDATVPVLALDNGEYLTESNAICYYLESEFPEPPLIGQNGAERAATLMWNQKIEFNLLLAIAECFRNTAPGMRGRAITGPNNYKQIDALAKRGWQRASDALVRFNARLEDAPYVAGAQFTMADITLKVAVDFTRWIKLDVPESLSALHEWNQRVQARPAAAL